VAFKHYVIVQTKTFADKSKNISEAKNYAKRHMKKFFDIRNRAVLIYNKNV
jgi:hypothetical protein